MTTASQTIRTNSVSTITSAPLEIGTTATSVIVGNGVPVTIGNLGTINLIKPKVVIITTQSYTVTVGDIIAGSIFSSTFSSAPTLTVNDIITINLPTPTADIEGIIVQFRKLRGGASNSTQNWIFNCPTSSLILSNAVTLTTSGQPTSTATPTNYQQRMTVLKYFDGSTTTYYWVTL